MRAAASLAVCLLLAGCSGGGSAQRATELAKASYIVNVEAMPTPMRTGSSGAPMMGLAVSGNITNTGGKPLPCSANQFVLVHSGSDIAPATAFCSASSIAPRQSAYFHATFLAPPKGTIQLHFEHGDGSYEVAQVTLSSR